uniref:Uncharacterized protein n=1 Tax=Arundo donax TaxID=35708 RepID=A0A0A9F8S3_ARUDO
MHIMQIYLLHTLYGFVIYLSVIYLSVLLIYRIVPGCLCMSM